MLPRTLLSHPLFGVLAVASVLAALTAILAPLVDEDAVLPVALGYLLVALMAAALWGWLIGLLTALAANLLVNFFFVPPLHTFTVQHPENVVALVIFLAVAAIGAGMLSLLRRQVLMARSARAESEILLSLSNEAARGVSARDSMTRLCEAMARALRATSCSIVQQTDRWAVLASSGGPAQMPRDEEALAAQATAVRTIVVSPSSIRTPGPERRLPGSTVTYVPVPDVTHPAAIRLTGRLRPPAGVELQRLLGAFANQAAIVLDRARLQQEALRIASLQRADEFKSALLSSVSHDLRSPLMAIRTSVESLRDDSVNWSDEDRQAFLGTIDAQSERLTATVTNLLEMSRLEGGAVRPKTESISVTQLYDEVTLATAHTRNGRPLDSDAPSDLSFRGDWGLAVQALENLVENASKYSHPGTPIHLLAERAGANVLLTVADEGPGIPSTDLPHVFEKFYRGSSNAGTGGSGLGLAIAKAMVEIIGGSIRVESSPAGTRFVLSLPAAPLA